VSETPIHNLLTVKETAEYLRIPLPTVYYLVQCGKIPAIQIGGRWRIKKSSLDRDLLRHDKQGQPTVLVVDDDLKRPLKSGSRNSISCFWTCNCLMPPVIRCYKTAKQIDPDLNVIVITGYPDSEILNRILQVGLVTVLKKPLKVGSGETGLRN